MRSQTRTSPPLRGRRGGGHEGADPPPGQKGDAARHRLSLRFRRLTGATFGSQGEFALCLDACLCGLSQQRALQRALPIGAMKRKAAGEWEEVVVGSASTFDGGHLGVVCLMGGLAAPNEGAAGFVLTCEERDVGDRESSRFVAVGKNRMWVMKVVGGPACVKGNLHDTKVLEELHKVLQDGEGTVLSGALSPEKGSSAGAAAGAAAAAAANAAAAAARTTDEPMDALKVAKKGKKSEHPTTPPKSKGHPRGTVVQVKMPMTPKPGDQELIEVTLYENKQGILHVRADALPWILRYMYDETQGARVPEPPGDDEKSYEEDRPWSTRWCPSGAWIVEMRGGPLAGSIWASRLVDLTEEKWAAGAALLNQATPWECATRDEKKEVLLAYVEHRVAEAHAEAIATSPSQSDSSDSAP